jgi:hypothetical protein
MSKTVPFKHPTPAPSAPTPVQESWVLPKSAAPMALAPPTAEDLVPMSKITFEVPEDLHIRYKMQCLRRRTHEKTIGRRIVERAVQELENETL